VSEGVLGPNLARLPRGDPILVLGDGGRALPEALAERAAAALHSDFMNVGDLVHIDRERGIYRKRYRERLPEALAERAAAALHSDFMNVGDLVHI